MQILILFILFVGGNSRRIRVVKTVFWIDSLSNLLLYREVENAELPNFRNILHHYNVAKKINISIITAPSSWLQITISFFPHSYRAS